MTSFDHGRYATDKVSKIYYASLPNMEVKLRTLPYIYQKKKKKDGDATGNQYHSESARYSLFPQCGGLPMATSEVWAIIHNCSHQKVETAKQNDLLLHVDRHGYTDVLPSQFLPVRDVNRQA